MQALVTSDVSRIDICLDPEHVYVQVFARAGGQHGVLDLLGVTRAKRLAILELKATENPDLPLQAADYWTRIRRHQAQGDWVRYGYFAGMELHSAAPLVYLVAPALRFHPTTTTNPELPVAGNRSDARGSGGELAPRLAGDDAPVNAHKQEESEYCCVPRESL